MALSGRLLVWMLARSVCAVKACCSCVYSPANPSQPTTLTSYWHNSFPTHLSLSFFPLTPCVSLILSLTLAFATPSPWFRGFSWGRTLSNCWASVTHFVRPRPASVDAAGHFKGGTTGHSKTLANNTTLTIIICFTDSVGIVGRSVADCEECIRMFRCWEMDPCSICIPFWCFCMLWLRQAEDLQTGKTNQ